MVTQTGSGLSVMRSHQRFLPAVGRCAHTNKDTQSYALTQRDTHTHTAGLPVSADLGWALETLHGFHIHSSPPSPSIQTGSQLILLFNPLPSFSSPISPFHFHREQEVTELQPVGASSFHLSRPFRDSDVRVREANISKCD